MAQVRTVHFVVRRSIWLSGDIFLAHDSSIVLLALS
jgi:hypothetical protein